jgi:hypothetical protein
MLGKLQFIIRRQIMHHAFSCIQFFPLSKRENPLSFLQTYKVKQVADRGGGELSEERER